MTVLVFGRTGQVAQALQDQIPDGVDAAFLGRDRVDLTQPAQAAQAIHDSAPALVINAAAYTAVDQAETNTHQAMRVNADAPAAMARACADLAIPLLHISTDYVFDGAGNAPFAPDHACAPLNVYGRSKRAGEVAFHRRPRASRHVDEDAQRLVHAGPDGRGRVPRATCGADPPDRSAR